ncbi:MAG: hypothetical protein WC440_03830 [Candidatus Omnitrophota bacterium]|jgi:hypothetical protein
MTGGQVISIKATYSFFSLAALLFGIFLIRKPQLAIAIQKKFYEKINWRIEPISMDKEIRSTRLLGIFTLGVFLFSIVYACTIGLIP